ncbi:MAG: ABC transporter permease [Phycisphaerae bacterium]|nr:ABC transporter permease [Phycisphaerae bacterium]
MMIFEQLAAIGRNTFYECVRQPVVLVVLIAGSLLIVMSIPFSAYTLMDDQRMFVDIALSTIFICGTVLASFLATNALSREIDNKTVLTVVSKPVPRPIFVVGKWLGVGAALTSVALFLGLVFLIVELHGTMPNVATPYHFPVLIFGISAVLATAGAALWANFFYGWPVSSATLVFGVPILAVAYLICVNFNKDWSAAGWTQFEGKLWTALLVMWMSLLVLTGVAVAASTRFGQVVTLGITLGTFLLGLMSDWIFGRHIAHLHDMFARMDASQTAGSIFDWNHVLYAMLRVGYAVVPNFQVFWLSDAVQQGRDIPGLYVASNALYCTILITMMLSLAVVLFQRREVG